HRNVQLFPTCNFCPDVVIRLIQPEVSTLSVSVFFCLVCHYPLLLALSSPNDFLHSFPYSLIFSFLLCLSFDFLLSFPILLCRSLVFCHSLSMTPFCLSVPPFVSSIPSISFCLSVSVMNWTTAS